MIFFVDKATTKELLRTECGLRVTQDTNIVCQIKKGQVDRMWQNSTQDTEKKCPLILYIALVSIFIQWKLFQTQQKQILDTPLKADFTWYFS